ncbi:hypothetical protein M8J76_011367 [Diaphorina citri]|nr:hypothetical protein M8J76_011367 [Diaphorina citri]
MSFCVKLSLAKKLSQALKINVGPSTIDRIVKNLRLSSQHNGENIHYSLPCKIIDGFENINIRGGTQFHIDDDNVILPVDKTEFITQVLTSTGDKHVYKTQLNCIDKVVVEFSSPNIAKPFHVGHFRGTVLGNFVANLSNYFANNVVCLNYLGDWGTQFGLLQIGLNELNIKHTDLEQSPLDVLYKAYVKANDLAKINPDVQEQASNIFQQLECGKNTLHTKDWLDFQQVTLNELRGTYERLGIHFNEYHWESDYAASKITPILTDLHNLSQVIKEADHLMLPVGDRNITLVKSNGSTMYITRDVAAAIDRQKRYQFSKMLYVTDLSQENHFKDLVHILDLLGYPWHSHIEHIRYGKVQGMSTREGKGVFLKDLLDEARDRMYVKQKESKTTRVSLDDTGVSDTLGMSALIVYNLKIRRLKSYNFNWDECLHMSGDGGVKLQYSHCRLVSLAQECNAIQPPDHCDPKLLAEPVALQLILDIARFDEVLYQAHESYDSSIVVRYLFNLTNSINKALKQLQVKGAEHHVSQHRLLLFNKARLVLNQGMCVLGLKPLDKM